jgi:hypothetical protein
MNLKSYHRRNLPFVRSAKLDSNTLDSKHTFDKLEVANLATAGDSHDN